MKWETAITVFEAFLPTCTRGGLMGCECVSVGMALCVRECVSAGAGAMTASTSHVLPCASSQRKCLVGGQRSQTNTRRLKADGTVCRRSGQQSTCTLKEADTAAVWEVDDMWYVCQRGCTQVYISFWMSDWELLFMLPRKCTRHHFYACGRCVWQYLFLCHYCMHPSLSKRRGKG